MLAGKDHVAKSCRSFPLNPADPIYLLAQRILGTSDKSAPGVRRFMQLVGQWGWGCLSNEYPLSVERALFIDKLRFMGLQGGWLSFPDGKTGIPWDTFLDFGREKEFWINILIYRLKQLLQHQQQCIEWLKAEGSTAKQHLALQPDAVAHASRPLNLCVSSVRYEHELSPLKHHGFEHYLVMCSEETRQERMKAKGYQPNLQDANDISESLARKLATTLPDNQIIWNDHRPMPEGKSYHLLADFVTIWTGEKSLA